MRMWEQYERELRKAQEAWQENDCPPDVTAVALATGMKPDDLWEVVEGQRGWESHDPGYAYVVWVIAWELRGHPDWIAD